MNQRINFSLENFPEYLSSDHLVQLGIYKSIDSAYQARLNGHSPRWLKLRHKVLYPKKAVIEFLESRMVEDSSDNNAATKEKE